MFSVGATGAPFPVSKILQLISSTSTPLTVERLSTPSYVGSAALSLLSCLSNSVNVYGRYIPILLPQNHSFTD